MGRKISDLREKRFGKLTVIKRVDKEKHDHIYWLCKCDCGNYTKVRSTSLRKVGSKFKSTRSCGCLVKEVVKKIHTKHGHAVNGTRTKTYQVWLAMHQRCNNLKNPEYKNYGGRGIKICNYWLKFENFLKDMGESPKGLTLDRINNNGNYELENCRWTTMEIQNQNSRITMLNFSKVQMIKKLLMKSSLTQDKIAGIFKISQQAVSAIKTGHSWTNVNIKQGEN